MNFCITKLYLKLTWNLCVLYTYTCTWKIPSQKPLIFSFFIFSVTKFIRIGIADKNDNPPYFDKNLYEAEVDENEDIQHTVLTVTAKDHDECKYLNTSFIIIIKLRRW